MTMNKQLETWKSKFGEDWTDRNPVDPKTRVVAFKRMIGDLTIKSIVEIGCGAGHNLICLSKGVNPNYSLVGVDPSLYAVIKAIQNKVTAFTGDCFNTYLRSSYYDLVFTSGVLMHVAPWDMSRAVEEISRIAKKYILIIEYYSEKEESINYHGHNDLLWKRDYKGLFPNYQKGGFLSKEEGFDNCHWWLFQK